MKEFWQIITCGPLVGHLLSQDRNKVLLRQTGQICWGGWRAGCSVVHQCHHCGLTHLLQVWPVDEPGEQVVHLLVAAQVLSLVAHPPLQHSVKNTTSLQHSTLNVQDCGYQISIKLIETTYPCDITRKTLMASFDVYHKWNENQFITWVPLGVDKLVAPFLLHQCHLNLHQCLLNRQRNPGFQWLV